MVKPGRFLISLVSLHVLLWTLVPLLTRTVLPLDTIEGLTWGHAWQWGYDKNPYLNAWVSEVFALAGGASGWTLYLASALCSALCFVAIYQLAKAFFTEHLAQACAFLVEGIYYVNITSPQFNDNMLEIALWPLAALFFYRAIKTQTIKNWCILGFILGLSFMAKYLALLLVAPMGLFLLINSDARESFKHKAFYAAFLPFLVVTLPHIVWLFQHDFITLHYAFNRAARAPQVYNHFFYALKFTLEQALALLPSVLMSLWFISFKNRKSTITSFNQQFLWYVCAGPFLLLVLLSVVKGYALEPMWAAPMLAPFTLLIIRYCKPIVTPFRFKGLYATTLFVLGATVTGYALSIVYASPISSCHATAYYPGRDIAARATTLWHARFQSPLHIVVGPRWLAGNIAFYSPDRPQVYMEANPRVSTWIDEKELKKTGTLFVWEVTDNTSYALPSEWQARFPALILLPVQHFTEGACVISIGMAAIGDTQL